MAISALAVTAFGAIGQSANDPLQLIEYTPEEKAQLLHNSSEWKRLQIEIENAQLIQKQLNEDSKRIQQGVDQRLSTLLPVAQAASIMPPGIEVKSKVAENTVDLDKLAYAVGRHETGNCTIAGSYGVMYNNCVGLKNGSIAPCPKIGINRMCIYDTPEQSYEAFKKVWAQGYGMRLPTIADAQAYSGSDRGDSWRNNVLKFYNQ